MTVALFHFYAAARAAVGTQELTLSGATIGDAVSALLDGLAAGNGLAAGGGIDEVREILARCSYLVDGVSTTDPATPLAAADRIDVLPPFAGG